MSQQLSHKPAPKLVATYTLRVEELQVTVLRKKIKKLYLRVARSGSHVEVRAPEHVSDAYIEQVVRKWIDWIRTKLQQETLRRPPPRYESGEEIRLLGRSYRLKITHRPAQKPAVELQNSSLILYLDPAGSTATHREAVLYAFYRQQLEITIQPLINFWQTRTGLLAREWRLKRMKTRWGTCNPKAGRIWLSVELAKASPACIEYVILHEIAHLYEPSHNHRFRDFMSHYMPDWRERRQLLNRHDRTGRAADDAFKE